MAGDLSESFSTEASTVDDVDLKFGFQRPEMYKDSNLSGTVEPYDRHVFLCYKSHESWPSRIEDSESDSLAKLFSAAVKARKNDIPLKTRLTICEGGEDIELSDGDVLIFPEMIKYRGLNDSDVDGFVEDVLVNGQRWTSGVPQVLVGSHVFVCAHNNRDRRCGFCGPILIEKFKQEIESSGFKNKVLVTACSHVGGHKYAGNVIIFCADPKENITGHWYGYVTPDDVSELLDQHICGGQVIGRIWRGQMGARIKEAEKSNEQALPNGNGDKIKSEESVNEAKTANAANCCQGAKGFSCCRDGNFDKQGANGEGLLSKWVAKLEKRQVFTTVAVVGAVATITLVYGSYRRSR